MCLILVFRLVCSFWCVRVVPKKLPGFLGCAPDVGFVDFSVVFRASVYSETWAVVETVTDAENVGRSPKGVLEIAGL